MATEPRNGRGEAHRKCLRLLRQFLHFFFVRFRFFFLFLLLFYVTFGGQEMPDAKCLQWSPDLQQRSSRLNSQSSQRPEKKNCAESSMR